MTQGCWSQTYFRKGHFSPAVSSLAGRQDPDTKHRPQLASEKGTLCECSVFGLAPNLIPTLL